MRACSAKGCRSPIARSVRTKQAGTLDVCDAHYRLLAAEGEIADDSWRRPMPSTPLAGDRPVTAPPSPRGARVAERAPASPSSTQPAREAGHGRTAPTPTPTPEKTMSSTTTCLWPDCDRKVQVHGLCMRDYARVRDHNQHQEWQALRKDRPAWITNYAAIWQWNHDARVALQDAEAAERVQTEAAMFCRFPGCRMRRVARGLCHKCGKRARALGVLDVIGADSPDAVFEDLALRWQERPAARTASAASPPPRQEDATAQDGRGLAARLDARLLALLQLDGSATDGAVSAALDHLAARCSAAENEAIGLGQIVKDSGAERDKAVRELVDERAGRAEAERLLAVAKKRLDDEQAERAAGDARWVDIEAAVVASGSPESMEPAFVIRGLAAARDSLRAERDTLREQLAGADQAGSGTRVLALENELRDVRGELEDRITEAQELRNRLSVRAFDKIECAQAGRALLFSWLRDCGDGADPAALDVVAGWLDNPIEPDDINMRADWYLARARLAQFTAHAQALLEGLWLLNPPPTADAIAELGDAARAWATDDEVKAPTSSPPTLVHNNPGPGVIES